MKKTTQTRLKKTMKDAIVISGGVLGEQFVEQGIDAGAKKIAPSLAQNRHYSRAVSVGAVAAGAFIAANADKISKSNRDFIVKGSIGVIIGGFVSLAKSAAPGVLSGTPLGTTETVALPVSQVSFQPSAEYLSDGLYDYAREAVLLA